MAILKKNLTAVLALDISIGVFVLVHVCTSVSTTVSLKDRCESLFGLESSELTTEQDESKSSSLKSEVLA